MTYTETQSMATKRRKMSAETKQKLSAAAREYWRKKKARNSPPSAAKAESVHVPLLKATGEHFAQAFTEWEIERRSDWGSFRSPRDCAQLSAEQVGRECAAYFLQLLHKVTSA